MPEESRYAVQYIYDIYDTSKQGHVRAKWRRVWCIDMMQIQEPWTLRIDAMACRHLQR